MTEDAGFVHLHNHSVYSVLDGVAQVDSMVARARELGMDSLAITDHGVLFGVIPFYKECKKKGVHPIIGCEIYICDDIEVREKHTEENPCYFHLLLLARDMTGYRNLVKLSSIAGIQGFYYKPRIDNRILRQHSAGLIGTSACLSGKIPWLIQKGRYEEARDLAREYASIFPEGDFFLEVQDNGIPEQREVNNVLCDFGRDLGIPLVATNDCHYVRREDSELQEVLICVQTGKQLADPDRMRMSTNEFYMKSPDEMASGFREMPEALASTVEIAKRCTLEFDFKGYHMPIFTVPEGEEDPGDLKVFFRNLVWRGAKENYGENLAPEVRERIEFELSVIQQMGYEDYFLIVWDFINYARKKGISVGPGRGSAAGSAVAYCLHVTDVEPMEHGLLFERFLNPERISMPDIDTDFSDKRRDEVIEYVRKRYGNEKVSQIGTFGTLKARSAIRDVARVMGFPASEGDRISKAVPEGLDVTIESALETSPEFREIANSTPNHRKVVELAQGIEGAIRQTGVHAAGVVIGDADLSDIVPMMRPQKGEICTQFDMNVVEQVGLVKMDFLGLRTLSIIDDTIENIRAGGGPAIDWKTISLDDPKTYELLSQARTTGIFQLESRGMKDILKKLRPGGFSDLVPVLGLYRPGPLGSGLVDEFIKRRHNPSSVRYDHPAIEPILKETYGIIIYQEQAMRIANVLCGFSLGQADIMRKAMGKKNAELMAKLEKDFIDGGVAKGVDPEVTETLWRKIEQFAGYGFNKSHTVAYAVITFRTAYLKAHYPAEFMAAALTNEMHDTEKVAIFIRDCRSMGIEVLPPDVNESRGNFSVVNGRIRYGLEAIKNLGHNAVETIVRGRKKGGAYKDLMDFCERIGPQTVNVRGLQVLIRSGAMDCFGHTRKSLLAVHEEALRKASAGFQDKMIGQMNLLDGVAPETRVRVVVPNLGEDPKAEVLQSEAELLGVSLSGHLLDEHEESISLLSVRKVDSLQGDADLAGLRLAGIVRSVERRTSARGNPFARCRLEDRTGSVEVTVFESVLETASPLLVEGNTVVVEGDGEMRTDSVGIRARGILSLEQAVENAVERVEITVPAQKADPTFLQELRLALRRSKGGSRVWIVLDGGNTGVVVVDTGEDFTVRPGKGLREALGAVLPPEAVKYCVAARR